MAATMVLLVSGKAVKLLQKCRARLASEARVCSVQHVKQRMWSSQARYRFAYLSFLCYLLHNIVLHICPQLNKRNPLAHPCPVLTPKVPVCQGKDSIQDYLLQYFVHTTLQLLCLFLVSQTVPEPLIFGYFFLFFVLFGVVASFGSVTIFVFSFSLQVQEAHL